VAGYEILGELGRGGMGVVYRARQQSLGRLVALKMLLPNSGAGAEELARFRREAEAVAALRHANFVHIYDVGEQDGRPFFVLEFVDGGSLASRLATLPPPPGEAARLLETLARAMHRAHQSGIVHRDLKPANILLMADGTPKIADFGLAKKLDAPGSQTRTGAILGTPSYMAPEQAQGRTSDIGPASDVYALGAILYEALTGSPPFQAYSLLDLLYQVVHQPPLPPSRLRPDVPPDLERICLRCLEKDPAQRYASAADLAEDLHRHLAGQPIHERTLRPPQRKKVTNRRWLRIWGSAAGILVALAGISLAWHLWPSPDSRTGSPGQGGTPVLVPNKNLVQPRPPGQPGAAAAAPNNTRVQKEPVTIPWGAGKLACLAFAPDGQAVALGGESKTVELRDVKTGERRAAFEGHPGPVFSLAFAPTGKMLAVGSYKQIWLWDVATGKERGVLKGHEEKVQWIGFTDGGETLSSIGPDDRKTCLKVWSVDARKQRGGLDALGGRLELSPDGKYLAQYQTNVFNQGCFLKLWEVVTAKTVRALPEQRFYYLAFAPDSRSLVAGAGMDLRVLDVPSFQERGRHTLHVARVHSLAISPDGRTLASGSEDKTAILWSIATKEERATLKGHAGPVLVRFSPDGQTLATGSAADAFVKLWDVASGKERTALPGHTAGVVDLRFSPNGQTLAVVGRDETVKLWTVPPE
jgi:serine/threonine protein kinase